MEGAIPRLESVLNDAVKQDDYLKKIGEGDRIDDKTLLILKRT